MKIMKITTRDILASEATMDIIDEFQEDFCDFLRTKIDNIEVLSCEFSDYNLDFKNETLTVVLSLKIDGTKEDIEKAIVHDFFDYDTSIDMYYADKKDVDEEYEFAVSVNVALVNYAKITDFDTDDDGIPIVEVETELRVSV